jgi:SAM-dependent methyltransferase
MFEPNYLGFLVNPFFISRKELLSNIKSLGFEITGVTLDIGCGIKPYEKNFHSGKYYGVDVPASIHKIKLFSDIIYDGKMLPISDECIDSVVCMQVFEHVFEPERFLSEVNRVLKLDGKLLITLPFVWNEHEQPNDFARYSSFGIRYLLNKFGFEIKTHIKTAQDFSIIAQLFNLYLYKLVYNKNTLLKKILTIFLMAPVTVLGIFLGKILLKNHDLFLDNIILAKKKQSITTL